MQKHILHIFVVLAIGLFMTGPMTLAQEKSDEELKKEYAPVLGEYVFDWGGRIMTLTFYVEENALWVDSGDGRPVTMKPDIENIFEFTAEDSINGTFEIKFLKNDRGEYALCHLVNSGMGWDIMGNKKD